MIEKTLRSLGLSANSIRIYERLLEMNSASARQLAENLGLPRPSVYDNMKPLIQYGLVLEQTEGNKKLFQLDDVRHLPQLLRTKIELLEQEERSVKKMLPQLGKRARSVEPRIKFYPGAEGVRQMLNDILWYDHTELLSLWPFQEMVAVLGQEYFAHFHRRRLRQSIAIRTVWPRDKTVSFKDYPFIGVGKKHLRQQRLAPNGQTWNMGNLIYGDKVSFISSQQEAFGFIVQSRDFADLMRTQFEVLWKISTPVKAQPQYSEAFLKTV